MKLKVVSTIGQNSTLSAADSVFAVKFNQQLIAQAIRVYLSNQRQGTSKVKTRSEINRSKKKWFKQKGTGNARHGARTPNIFVGGGVAHGPTGEQNWTLSMPTAMRRAALASALSAQVENIVVTDDMHRLDGKTASAQKMLSKMLPEAKHILVVLTKTEPMIARSLRNLESVYMTTADRLTTFEVAYADAIVFTKDAVHALEKRIGESSKKQDVKAEERIEKPAEKPVAKQTAKKVAVKKAAPKAKAKPKTATKKK